MATSVVEMATSVVEPPKTPFADGMRPSWLRATKSFARGTEETG